MIAFYDADASGQRDSDSEPVLGRIELSDPLPAGAGRSLDLVMEGPLPFRDAPLSILVDSRRAIVELDESNNLSKTSESCALPAPAPGRLDPVEKWHWTGADSVAPEYDQIVSAPVVAQLDDDNGDGEPEIGVAGRNAYCVSARGHRR